MKTSADYVSQHRVLNTPRNQHQSMGTSEYRSSPVSNLTEINNSIISYSYAAKLDSSPTKDEAIIHALDISLQDAFAIEKLISLKAIRYISKISNNRICSYLDKKEIVTHLTTLHKTITINNKTVNIRPMLTI